jgi:hypothetical protein
MIGQFLNKVAGEDLICRVMILGLLYLEEMNTEVTQEKWKITIFKIIMDSIKEKTFLQIKIMKGAE